MVMERIDFSPAALRKDLSGARSAAAYLYSAAELINHAADLSASSSAFGFGLNPFTISHTAGPVSCTAMRRLSTT